MRAFEGDADADDHDGESSKAVKTVEVEGGYKSTDDNYTYIRGRGRGKYICATCGVRCMHPSHLKIHIRTHTNIRPYTCKVCNLGTKSKTNLKKHMKTKGHAKKCIELGIIQSSAADDQQIDNSKSSSGETQIHKRMKSQDTSSM